MMGLKQASTAGEKACPEIAQTSLTDVPLEYSIGKSYDFGGLQEFRRGFSGKNPIPTCSLDAERKT
jgi:hypothetical protein